MFHVCDSLYRFNEEPRLLYFSSDGVPILVMVDFTLKESSIVSCLQLLCSITVVTTVNLQEVIT